MIVLAGLLIAAAVAGSAYGWNRSTDLLIRRQTRKQVVVELRTGETFRGLLDGADRFTVTLRDVAIITDTSKVPVDGMLILPRGDIKWLQRT